MFRDYVPQDLLSLSFFLQPDQKYLEEYLDQEYADLLIPDDEYVISMTMVDSKNLSPIGVLCLSSLEEGVFFHGMFSELSKGQLLTLFRQLQDWVEDIDFDVFTYINKYSDPAIRMARMLGFKFHRVEDEMVDVYVRRINGSI